MEKQLKYKISPIAWYINSFGLNEILRVLALDGQEFIKAAYLLIFKREADEGGIYHFDSYFGRGLGKEFIISDMLSSDEAKIIYNYEQSKRLVFSDTDEIENLTNTIKQLRSSFSWRITFPIRVLSRFIKLLIKIIYLSITDPRSLVVKILRNLAALIRSNKTLHSIFKTTFEFLPYNIRIKLIANIDGDTNKLNNLRSMQDKYHDLDSQTLWILSSVQRN